MATTKAPYKVDVERKKVTITRKLSELQEKEIDRYIRNGYRVIDKSTVISNRFYLNNQDILNYFEQKKDTKGLEQYETIKKERNWVHAKNWLLETYPTALQEIKELRQQKPKSKTKAKSK